MTRHSRSRPNFFIRLLLKWAGISYVPNNQHHTQTHHHRSSPIAGSAAGAAAGLDQGESTANTSKRNSHHHTSQRRQKKTQGWEAGIKRTFRSLTGFFTGNGNTGAVPTIKKLWAGFKKRIGIKPKRKPLPETLFFKTNRDGSYKIITATPYTATGMEEDSLSRPVARRTHVRRQKLRRKQKLTLKRLFQNIFAFLSKNKTRQKLHTSGRHNRRKALPTGANILPDAASLPRQEKARRSFIVTQLFESWKHKGYILKLLSSTGLFLTAYVVIWLVYSIAVIFTASFYNIDAVLYYYEVMWPAGNAMPPWSDLIAIAVTISGPFAAIIMAVLSFYLLKSRLKTGSHLRTFLFWIFLLSLAHFFGAFAAGAVTWEGFGYVMDWLHMRTFFIFLFSVLFLSALVFMGWRFARFVLETRPIRKHGANIPLILINRMILPMIIGSLILIAIKMPNSVPQHPYIYDYDCFILASGLFFAIPPLFNKKLKPAPQAYKTTSVKNQFFKTISIILLSIGIVMLYRLGLSSGLYVYMKFAVNVIPY
jgi:hypothetical protein